MFSASICLWSIKCAEIFYSHFKESVSTTYFVLAFPWHGFIVRHLSQPLLLVTALHHCNPATETSSFWEALFSLLELFSAYIQHSVWSVLLLLRNLRKFVQQSPPRTGLHYQRHWRLTVALYNFMCRGDFNHIVYTTHSERAVGWMRVMQMIESEGRG